MNTVIRARTGMLPLNSTRINEPNSRLCLLCNSREEEYVVPFLGRCTILTETRKFWFDKDLLDE